VGLGGSNPRNLRGPLNVSQRGWPLNKKRPAGPRVWAISYMRTPPRPRPKPHPEPHPGPTQSHPDLPRPTQTTLTHPGAAQDLISYLAIPNKRLGVYFIQYARRSTLIPTGGIHITFIILGGFRPPDPPRIRSPHGGKGLTRDLENGNSPRI
jgi:hypothetical protein